MNIKRVREVVSDIDLVKNNIDSLKDIIEHKTIKESKVYDSILLSLREKEIHYYSLLKELDLLVNSSEDYLKFKRLDITIPINL